MMRAMSHTDVRQARQQLEEMRSGWTHHLSVVPKDEWPPMPPGAIWPVDVRRSKDFFVQIYEPDQRGIIRLSACRCRILDDGNYSDVMSWEELMQIKTECGFGLSDAVEVYPALDDAVNVANMRHLWVLPKPLPFAWRIKRIVSPQ